MSGLLPVVLSCSKSCRKPLFERNIDLVHIVTAVEVAALAANVIDFEHALPTHFTLETDRVLVSSG